MLTKQEKLKSLFQMKNNSPFSHDYFLGYINQVTPYFIKVHFPSSTLMKSYFYEGIELNGGTVGNYVVIEGHSFGFLGKIIDVELPERERMELNESSFNTDDFHPAGRVEILLAFDLFNPERVDKGLNKLPNIGSKVYICRPDFIEKYFKRFGVKEDQNEPPLIELGKLTYDNITPVTVAQQALFGRHCAIVGTTGGGKSFTVSKLVQEAVQNNSKVILIDSTGEYKGLDNIESATKSLDITVNSHFSYSKLTVEDFFVLLRPSKQAQQPILLEAIKSLKIVECLKNDEEKYDVKKNGNTLTYHVDLKKGDTRTVVISNGTYVKKGNETLPFKTLYRKYVREVENNNNAHFDITNLPLQLMQECHTDYGDKWASKQDERNFNNCTSLIMRIGNLINDESFQRIFAFKKTEESIEITEELDRFIAQNEKQLLRISFENVPFDFQGREILANAIGKYLLQKSRNEYFKKLPLILCIDEAHQYLNKKVKDEYFESTKLDAFDLIAKECRKYGLFLCLATQMPRDIPVGTLSQIGTFIVHRLINPYDKESIENACSSANKNALSFLPILGAGEAVMMGVDFPMPVMLKVNLPKVEPDSGTPQFSMLKNEEKKEAELKI